jgi:membrane protease YdiL (CAAX protease family)
VLATAAGSALASISVTAITSGKAGLRLLLRRCVQWRVSIGWYLIAIFGSIPIWAVEFGVLYGVNMPIALLLKWTLIFTVLFPQAVISIVTASFAEELGWRGFALPRLQQRYGPVLGTLILGTLHGLWHLPAFFTGLLGPFSFPYYISFLFVAIAATFFYTWIFNHTKGSVLIATLTHGFGDAAAFVAVLIPAHLVVTGWARPFVYGGWQADNIVIFGALAVLLLVATRGRLGYNPERNAQLFEVPQPAEMPQASVEG